MYKYILFIVFLFSQLFSGYSVGDTISIDHQNMEFNYCYPSDSTSTFSLSKYSAKIIMIEMTASWWSECFGDLQLGDEIYHDWKNKDSRVAIFHLFSEHNRPWSCEQWGDQGEINVPPIINDGDENIMGNWFNDFNENSRPYTVFIDHNFVVRYFIDGRCNTDLFGDDVSPEVCVEKRIVKLLETLGSDLGTTSNPSFIKYFNITKLYPNPFNPVLHINFELSLEGLTQIDILDIAGAHIETIHSRFIKIGSHELSWHAESMPSGLYFISLKLGDQSLTEKVVLLKWSAVLWALSHRENNRFIIDEKFSKFARIFIINNKSRGRGFL